MLTELLLGVTAEGYRLKIGVFHRIGSVWPTISGTRSRPPLTILRGGKNRINVLSYSIRIFFVL